MALNPKQKAFVREYAVDHNATKAAERAGYSPKTAYAQGCRLLKHAEVSSAIAAKEQKVEERAEITAEFVLRGIVNTIRECEAEGPKFAAAALKGYELLGKTKKMFTDRIEHSGGIESLNQQEVEEQLEDVLARLGGRA